MSRLSGSIDQRKKDSVLEAAAALILAHGPGVSLGQIARHANVSKQTIYNYFGHKPGLFRAVLEHRARPSDCPLCVDPRDGGSALFLSAYAKSLLEWLGQMRLSASLQALVASERPRPAHAAKTAGGAVAAQALAALARVLADEARRGRMRIDDPAQAAELFFDLVTAGRSFGAVQTGFGPDRGSDIDAAADACGRVFARAFAADRTGFDDESLARAGHSAHRVSNHYPIHPREEASP